MIPGGGSRTPKRRGVCQEGFQCEGGRIGSCRKTCSRISSLCGGFTPSNCSTSLCKFTNTRMNCPSSFDSGIPPHGSLSGDWKWPLGLFELVCPPRTHTKQDSCKLLFRVGCPENGWVSCGPPTHRCGILGSLRFEPMAGTFPAKRRVGRGHRHGMGGGAGGVGSRRIMMVDASHVALREINTIHEVAGIDAMGQRPGPLCQRWPHTPTATDRQQTEGAGRSLGREGLKSVTISFAV